jgi:hypothetical protein
LKPAVAAKPPKHDHALFDALVDKMRGVEPELRLGVMFGCPAVFVGRRLSFCVFDKAVGAKVPAPEAARLIAAGEATPFRPYGKPAMKEWIELEATPATVGNISGVLTLALRYAKSGEAGMTKAPGATVKSDKRRGRRTA